MMNYVMPIEIGELKPRIQHKNSIMLLGSCFTEHITKYLMNAKFDCMQNSHGILFNPMSVCKAMEDVINQKIYLENDLFFLDEYWHSWFHHSDFSYRDSNKSLDQINNEIKTQHQSLKNADYLIITLGSAFAYFHLENQYYVSNNHRAPAAWFRKDLLTISDMKTKMQSTLDALKKFNPKLKVIFTISPVRHVRDGVIENNRSKARLLEVVHSLDETYYFPAYELVVDVLRDYRFYDIDLVHPNYQATAYVWENFVSFCIDPSYVPLLKELEQIRKSFLHKPKDTESKAHKKFLAENALKCRQLQKQFPYLNLTAELTYFDRAINQI